MAKAPKKIDDLKKEMEKEEAKKAEEIVVEETVVEETVVEEAPVIEKPTKKVIDKPTVVKKEEQDKLRDHDDILIMNNTLGRWGYESKRTGFSIKLEDYGSSDYIPFSELRTMNSSERAHIEKAYILILDERAVQQLGQGRLYDNLLDLETTQAIIHDNRLLNHYLPKLPTTMKETVIQLAIQGLKDRTITNVLVKDVIEKHLGIEIDI